MARSLRKIGFMAILGGIILLSSLLTAQTAEIRLKNGTVQVSEPLVTLADIADVMPMGNANNARHCADSLRRLILFPAPAAGATHSLDQWELRTILSQLGITSIHHLISGAERVTIVGAAPRMSAPSNPNQGFVIQANHLAPAVSNSVASIAGITDDFTRRLEREVAQALKTYLDINFAKRNERSWDIALNLTPEQVRVLASNGQIADISGGQIPFTGIQRFNITMKNNVTVTVEATVALPTEVVVVRRALPRGHIISEADVMLQRVERMRGDDFFVDIGSVVGRETTKAIRDLAPLTQSDVRKPLWVHRGEIVTVRAVSGGITITTEATAMQNGVEGDTIMVAKIDLSPRRGRQEAPVTYLARVCAPKTVEVFVR